MSRTIKYISVFGWVLFFISCASPDHTPHKTTQVKPSIYYSVSCPLGEKYPPPGNQGFWPWEGYYLDEERIKRKIGSILIESELFSLTQSSMELSDFQIKFMFEWEARTFSDDLMTAMKQGYIQGSFGLFPMYFSETLIMRTEVLKNSIKLGSYQYNADLRRWYWAGALVNLARDDEYKLEKIDNLVEKMTEAFIKDMDKEIHIE